MAELARGSVTDRPWGRTFATLALRGVTGQLTLVADGRHYLVAFEHGAVVAASSPLASDAAVRVALTGHLVSSSQVPEISRRLADAPERDEVDVIAELARLGPDHALRLHRRVIAQRAARTFSINHGEFSVTDDIELPIIPGCELDVRAVVYMGARANLSEQRLAVELDVLGSWFQLKPDLDEDLPQFGFSDVEQPVIERLRDGGTIAEIEAFATSFVDGRTVRAVVYALASYNACEVAAAPAGAMPSAPSPTTPPPGTQPRASTQPLPRTLTRPAAPDPARAPRPTPESARPLRPTPVPGSHLAPSSRTTTPQAASTTPSRTTSPSNRTPPGGRNPIVTSTGSLPTLTPPADPLDDGLDPPTQRDAIAAGTFPDPAHIREPRSSPALRLPLDEAPQDKRSSAGLRPPLDDPREMRSSPGLRLPLDDAPREARSTPGLRPPLDDAPREVRPTPRSRPSLDDPREMRARPALEDPRREPEGLGRATRDFRSTPGSRPPLEDPREMRSSPGLRLPPEEAPREARSTPGPRPPLDDSRREPEPSARGTRDSRSSPALRIPSEDAGPELVIRRVASRPAPTRQVARSDTPQSHEVKALIAQRIKLLDQGADHFQLLGVGHDAPPDAVRKAYFVVARQLHPDRLAALGISDDGRHAQRLFAQINAGFAILSNPSRRAHYLDILRRGGEAAVRAEQSKAEDLARRIMEAEEAFRRGELALRRDQPAAAVGELEVAVQLNPDEADYHALLAWAQFCAAPDKMAIATRTRTLLDRAIQRAPRSVTARFYLGRVERMLGSDKDALRHFRDVLAQAPGHAEAASEVRVLEARMLGGDKPGGGLFGRNKR